MFYEVSKTEDDAFGKQKKQQICPLQLSSWAAAQANRSLWSEIVPHVIDTSQCLATTGVRCVGFFPFVGLQNSCIYNPEQIERSELAL